MVIVLRQYLQFLMNQIKLVTATSFRDPAIAFVGLISLLDLNKVRLLVLVRRPIASERFRLAFRYNALRRLATSADENPRTLKLVKPSNSMSQSTYTRYPNPPNTGYPNPPKPGNNPWSSMGTLKCGVCRDRRKKVFPQRFYLIIM